MKIEVKIRNVGLKTMFCDDCQKTVLHERGVGNKDGKTIIAFGCLKCGKVTLVGSKATEELWKDASIVIEVM